MNIRQCLISGIVLGGCFCSTLALAASRFENSTLYMPYLVLGEDLYNVNLNYVANSDPIDFTLDEYTMYEMGTTVPNNAAFFAGNVLSIPALRVANETYDLQLDFIEASAVFRLLENPALLSNSTDGVLCSYVDSTENSSASLTITSTSSWTCSGNSRTLTANGIPDHPVGTFPNEANPNTITEQSVSATISLEPVETGTATTLGGPAGVLGYVLNGVKIDAGTGGTCDDSGDTCDLGQNVGAWRIEAMGQTSFDFGTDDNNAHVQPDGQYHYHGIPEGFVSKQGGNSSTMTIIGWAGDGFPIYARYGYSVATDSSSDLKNMTGSYEFVSNVSDSRPSVDTYPLGTFNQDWNFVEGSGDLDECNGRFGVTPEFPAGIYHYYATDSYPFFQRCVTGFVEATGGGPGGGPPPPPQ
jgi:hypothetical protein